MRKLPVVIAALSVIACTNVVKAQYYPAPLGIGMPTTDNINATLEVKKNAPYQLGPVLRLTGGGMPGAQGAFEIATFDPGTNPANFRIIATDLGDYAARVEFQSRDRGQITDLMKTRMTLNETGSVAFNGDLIVGPENHNVGFGPKLDFGMNSNSDPMSIYRYNVASDVSEMRVSFSDNSQAIDRFIIGVTDPGGYKPLMNVNGNGVVSIGTTITNDLDYKLFVETGIRTRKVKVDAVVWADYVFHANYRLRPLSEVEQYIKEHGHLPEVPSEEEVSKEGIDLGNNQAILLKKIEELTLYVIEQNKRQENLEKLIQKQQERLAELEKKLKEKVSQ